MNLLVRKFKSFMIYSLVIAFIFGFMMIGCQSNTDKFASPDKDGVKVLASTSFLADMAKNVVGQLGTVEYIIPIGEGPEHYEMLPSDLRKASNADLLILNGLGLEEMILSSIKNVTNTKILFASDGVEAIPLVGENTPDPHAWLDVRWAIQYVKNIYDGLSAVDPDNASQYLANADAYIEELIKLDRLIKDSVVQIPESKRVIIISENAMKYFGEAYGFQTEGIWELNSHEEGTPQQISRIIDLVRDKQIPALFTETTVDTRYMDTIAKETGVVIAGQLYTDAIGLPDSGADSYIGMMQHNLNVLIAGLTVQ